MTSDSVGRLLPVFQRARDQLSEAGALIETIDRELNRGQIYADDQRLVCAAAHAREFASVIQALEQCLAELGAAGGGNVASDWKPHETC